MTVPQVDNSAVDKPRSPRSAARAPRFLLLMPQDLRYEIERVATANGRTLTAEINMRLRSTLPSYGSASNLAHVVAEPAAQFADRPGKSGAKAPTAVDLAMLELFQRLTEEMQAALIELLR